VPRLAQEAARRESPRGRHRGGRSAAHAAPAGNVHDRLLELQRSAGNAAVTDLLVQRKADSLRMGSHGQDVKELQSAMNHTDEVVVPLAVDGIFGPITDKAVRQFQAAHPPMQVDGIVGPVTRGAIDQAATEDQDAEALARKLFLRATEAYEKKHQYAIAYDLFTRASELAPRSSVTFARAQSLRRLGGRNDEAIALFEQYLAEGGGSKTAEAQKALVELKGPAATGDSESDTATARAQFVKGSALYEQGDYAHAYDELTKADKLAHRPSVTFARAQCLRRLGGHREKAIELFELYLAENPAGERVREARFYASELATQGAVA
jgi:peptidoglycan hydrolase-like protein with peptidoglycan-binding domain